MACNQTLSGLVIDCDPSMGGIVEVLAANFADVTAKTLSSNEITAITMASSAKFHRYELPDETGYLNSTWNINKANGTRFVLSELYLALNKMETAKKVEVEALTAGRFALIVKDNNGKYWYLGYDAPVTASAGDGVTGTAYADRNGYSLTMQDNSKAMPYEVDPDIIDDLVA